MYWSKNFACFFHKKLQNTIKQDFVDGIVLEEIQAGKELKPM